MKNTARKNTSTQKFIEIEDIVDNIVFFSGQNASLVIEVTATNFALLSKEEQDAKIASYVSFLNSLSFPVQIFIRNKKLDISSYLRLLETEEKREQNQVVRERIRLYREFVGNMVKVNVVLDKRFYIALSYSGLEKGAISATAALKNKGKFAGFSESARASLHAKAQTIQSQFTSLNLKTKILGKQELIQLFYEIYNGDSVHTQAGAEINPPIIRQTA